MLNLCHATSVIYLTVSLFPREILRINRSFFTKTFLGTPSMYGWRKLKQLSIFRWVLTPGRLINHDTFSFYFVFSGKHSTWGLKLKPAYKQDEQNVCKIETIRLLIRLVNQFPTVVLLSPWITWISWSFTIILVTWQLFENFRNLALKRHF